MNEYLGFYATWKLNCTYRLNWASQENPPNTIYSSVKEARHNTETFTCVRERNTCFLETPWKGTVANFIYLFKIFVHCDYAFNMFKPSSAKHDYRRF